jgi:hypothetical protein
MSKAKKETPCENTCGSCVFYKKHETDKPMEELIGICHAMPPTILTDEDNDPFSIRPLVEQNDMACAFYRRVMH